MKVSQAKFKQAVALPETVVSNTESYKPGIGMPQMVVLKNRVLAVVGKVEVTLVPLENVAWMKMSREEAEAQLGDQLTAPPPAKASGKSQ
jgi:hypothetical protein